MEHVTAWLETLPPALIYLVVGLIIGIESMGVPLPGEITLISAALLSAGGVGSPWGVACAATLGAVVGDSIGYAIGRRGGRGLLERLGRRFPKHLGAEHLSRAERLFDRWGVWAVFFGRFVALLRILAGPLAGALHVPYRKFLLANAGGGLVWAFGTTFVLYGAGAAAEHWIKKFQWGALILALVFGAVTSWWFKRRGRRLLAAAAEPGCASKIGSPLAETISSRHIGGQRVKEAVASLPAYPVAEAAESAP